MSSLAFLISRRPKRRQLSQHTRPFEHDLFGYFNLTALLKCGLICPPPERGNAAGRFGKWKSITRRRLCVGWASSSVSHSPHKRRRATNAMFEQFAHRSRAIETDEDLKLFQFQHAIVMCIVLTRALAMRCDAMRGVCVV